MIHGRHTRNDARPIPKRILGGRNLIRSAKLRSVMSDLETFMTATNTFQLKYDAMPGDMPNATDYWGAADGGDGIGDDCRDIDSTGSPLTCNGNGDMLLPKATALEFQSAIAHGSTLLMRD